MEGTVKFLNHHALGDDEMELEGRFENWLCVLSRLFSDQEAGKLSWLSKDLFREVADSRGECEGTNVKSQKAGGLPGVLACALKPSTGVAEAEGWECKAGLDKTGKSCIETKTNQWSFPNPV